MCTIVQVDFHNLQKMRSVMKVVKAEENNTWQREIKHRSTPKVFLDAGLGCVIVFIITSKYQCY